MLQIDTLKQAERIATMLGFDTVGQHETPSFPLRQMQIARPITFDEMADIVDYLRASDVQDELFEECWKTYQRKGSKKKSLEYWKKLSRKDKEKVMPHLKHYVQAREIQYRKDFERYLRDKTFNTVVYNGNLLAYDPTRNTDDAYRPQTSPLLMWNDYFQNFIYLGYWDGHIADGYSDDERPDGATITLNNGRGTIRWSKEQGQWEKL